MNITFLIGNGFDIRMGIKSSYKDAEKNYVNITSDDPDLIKFKNDIDPNHKYWSNFELAMGDYTGKFGPNAQSIYKKCINDFSAELTKYLMAEEERISYELCDDEIKSTYKDSLTSFLKDLDEFPALKDDITNVINAANDNIYFNFLSFNYTRILDECLSRTFDNNTIVGNHAVGSRGYNHYVNNKVIHVHGKFPTQIIIGVDNNSQISNQAWAKMQRFCDAIVKPRINQRSGRLADKNAKKVIDSSCVICVFGMSLGETDLTWWDYIGKWLKKNDHRLVIFTYDPKITDASTFPQRFDIEDNIKDDFMGLANIDESERDQLDERVHVVINSKLFDIDLVKLTKSRTQTPVNIAINNYNDLLKALPTDPIKLPDNITKAYFNSQKLVEAARNATEALSNSSK